MKTAIFLLCALSLFSISLAAPGANAQAANYGSLSVTTSPSDARVEVFTRDGNVAHQPAIQNGDGRTPFYLERVLSGTYQLRITKDGYYPEFANIVIPVNNTLNVSVTLRQTGVVNIFSEPTGAQITIRGTSYGTTPRAAVLAVGTYTIIVSKDGYLPSSANVTVHAGDNITQRFALRAPTGSLRVETYPSRANIFIDNIAKGATPSTVSNLSAGQHSVFLTKTGYQNYSTNVQIRTGELSVLNATLERIPQAPQVGNLTITSSPDGASIYINGKSYGTTPATIPLTPAANYKIIVRKAGYYDYNGIKTVFNGKTATISATLSRVQQVQANVTPLQNTTNKTTTTKTIKKISSQNKDALNKALAAANALGIGVNISQYEEEIEASLGG